MHPSINAESAHLFVVANLQRDRSHVVSIFASLQIIHFSGMLKHEDMIC